MPGLRDVCLALQAIEAGLELSAALKQELLIPSGKVSRAYLTLAELGKAPQIPSFMNWPDTYADARMGNHREDTCTIQVDFLGPRDGIKGGEIALAFFDLAWDALDAQRPAGQRLDGLVDLIELRAIRPLVDLIEWNGLSYPGFHIFVDITMHKDVTP